MVVFNYLLAIIFCHLSVSTVLLVKVFNFLLAVILYLLSVSIALSAELFKFLSATIFDIRLFYLY